MTCETGDAPRLWVRRATLAAALALLGRALAFLPARASHARVLLRQLLELLHRVVREAALRIAAHRVGIQMAVADALEARRHGKVRLRR